MRILRRSNACARVRFDGVPLRDALHVPADLRQSRANEAFQVSFRETTFVDLQRKNVSSHLLEFQRYLR